MPLPGNQANEAETAGHPGGRGQKNLGMGATASEAGVPPAPGRGNLSLDDREAVLHHELPNR